VTTLIKLDQIRKFLESQPAGPLSPEISSSVMGMVIGVWDLLPNSALHATSAYKIGRAEDVHWEPPVLSFVLERHGATAMGSTRAELHLWRLNLETGNLEGDTTRYRQLYPRAKSLNVNPIAENLAKAIISKDTSDERLDWKNSNRVKLRMALIIPDDTHARTVVDRRKRFRKALNEILLPNGWKEVRPNNYERIT